MKLSDLVLTANRNLFRAKLRTLLTVTAVFVGSFTLTLTNSAGDGLNDYIKKQVRNYEGESVLFVHKKSPEDSQANLGVKVIEYREETKNAAEIDPRNATVSVSQIEGLAREFPEVQTFTPNYDARAEYVTLDGNRKYVTRVTGVVKGMSQKIDAGGQIDGDGQIVLQYEVAKVFGLDFSNLIGKEVLLGYKVGNPPRMFTEKLRVVGVATPGFMISSLSSIDLATARKMYETQKKDSPDYDRFANFSLQLNSADPQKVAELKRKLATKGFEAETYAEQNRRIYDAINTLRLGLNMFALISLLAASFGIINTLVIAVMERAKEVGLQRALGMGRGKVFLLFSIESILIGFWGAVLGVIIAVIVGLSVSHYLAKNYLDSFAGYQVVVFTPESIAFVISLICAIAFIASVFPAVRASRLNPIEALRYE